MKCPICKDTNLVITERKEIEIDYCPQCRGIWLDRGELDKLLEKTRASEMESMPPSPNPIHSYPSNPPPQSGYYHKPYKRKKTFLEELFD